MTGPKYYWEDFAPGDVAEFGHYAVSSEEIIAFASEYDPQTMHIDAEAAKKTFIGGLCASGWHSCAMAMRMICDHYLLDSASPGLSGIEESKWRAPVRPGDVLTMKRECLARGPSDSRSGMGVARFRHTMTNQHGEVKMILEGEISFARRGPEAGA